MADGCIDIAALFDFLSNPVAGLSSKRAMFATKISYLSGYWRPDMGSMPVAEGSVVRLPEPLGRRDLLIGYFDEERSL